MVDDMAPKQRSLSTEVLGPPARIGFDDRTGKPHRGRREVRRESRRAGAPAEGEKDRQGRLPLCAQDRPGQSHRNRIEDTSGRSGAGGAFSQIHAMGRSFDLLCPSHPPRGGPAGRQGGLLLPWATSKAAGITRGHTLSWRRDAFGIGHPDDYVDALRKRRCHLRYRRTKGTHRYAAVRKAAADAGGRILDDPELLDIVTNLVENPVATAGQFDAEFLEIPREILITAMREHQKYFAVVDGRGQSCENSFVAVNNTRTRDLALVAAGHGRVLKGPAQRCPVLLPKRPQGAGGRADGKARRGAVPGQAGVHARKIPAHHCPGRLPGPGGRRIGPRSGRPPSGRRGCARPTWSARWWWNFPNSRGSWDGSTPGIAEEPGDVPAAVEEHYRPTRSGAETLPRTRTGALVSVADKIDSICGCFAIGLVPTGGADPYALRRQGIGLLQIMKDQGFSFSLAGPDRLRPFPVRRPGHLAPVETTARGDQCLFSSAAWPACWWTKAFPKMWSLPWPMSPSTACPMSGTGFGPWKTLKTAPDFAPLAAAFKRGGQYHQEGRGSPPVIAVEPGRFRPRQRDRFVSLPVSRWKGRWRKAATEGRYGEALREIATLGEPVDRFFDGGHGHGRRSGASKQPPGPAGAHCGAYSKQIADFSKLTA